MSSYSASFFSPSLHKMKTNLLPSSIVVPCLCSQKTPLYSSTLKLKSPSSFTGVFPELSVKCSSSSRPPGSGETDSKDVLDAFFLGKALAEAISERIESSIGELLSVVGRLQAEQQKQVQDFQVGAFPIQMEDVLERAKRAKEKAAREAMEAQGLAPKSTTVSTAYDVVPPAVSNSPATNGTPDVSASSSDPDITTTSNYSIDKDPLLGTFDDE
ncbi:hypothetical protein IFM89_027507 [Coptis chinensis]|uniref:Uncharacterized protein n=1 Tax=Coptis chinensis TaxID=261450 RepID=A0A835I738_9MAGN|nr:hypothetical protein IFM89_027507 [Coptis chinensis]